MRGVQCVASHHNACVRVCNVACVFGATTAATCLINTSTHPPSLIESSTLLCCHCDGRAVIDNNLFDCLLVVAAIQWCDAVHDGSCRRGVCATQQSEFDGICCALVISARTLLHARRVELFYFAWNIPSLRDVCASSHAPPTSIQMCTLQAVGCAGWVVCACGSSSTRSRAFQEHGAVGTGAHQPRWVDRKGASLISPCSFQCCSGGWAWL